MEQIRSNNPEKKKIEPDKFYRVISRFPEEGQSFIADLSSSLLEADVAQEIKRDPRKREEIASQMKERGMSPVQIHFVFDFFDLPRHQFAPKKNFDK